MAAQLPGMQYAEPVRHRMHDFSKGGVKMQDDEDANVGDAIIGVAIIAVIVLWYFLLVKGIIALFILHIWSS